MSFNGVTSGDDTCEPSLRSWVPSANDDGTDFPLQNLPFGVFRAEAGLPARMGVAIGEMVLDLHGLADEGCLAGLASATAEACRQETLNALMGLGRKAAVELRLRLSQLLREDASAEEQDLLAGHLLPQAETEMLQPAQVGDFTDFYASIEHATRAGRIFRPERPLLDNYKHLPVAYHGRASSVVVSGTAVARPRGQRLMDGQAIFAPSVMLDYEAELGLWIGAGNALGQAVPIEQAPECMFGCCLLNDWSARDIQAWEYQPLGPFLGKSFVTTVSPWVVTMEALAPFRVAARARGTDDPPLLAYLMAEEDQRAGAIDVQMEVRLQSASMREQGMAPVIMSQSRARELFWTLGQMVAHHTSNGCNLRAGDLLGTGTVSGADDGARACMLELTRRGEEPLTLPTGEQRAFLEDGDEVVLHAFCEREGAKRIGFGHCRGRVAGSIS